MAEYLEYRCCMCPQRNIELPVCPAGPFKQEETDCWFVKEYLGKNIVLSVQPAAQPGMYCIKGRRVGSSEWAYFFDPPYYESFDEAQTTLNRFAKGFGLLEFTPDGH